MTKVTLPRPQTYNVKRYHKSEKCRSQVAYRNLDEYKKIEFTVKGQKRSQRLQKRLQEILILYLVNIKKSVG